MIVCQMISLHTLEDHAEIGSALDCKWSKCSKRAKRGPALQKEMTLKKKFACYGYSQCTASFSNPHIFRGFKAFKQWAVNERLEIQFHYELHVHLCRLTNASLSISFSHSTKEKMWQSTQRNVILSWREIAVLHRMNQYPSHYGTGLYEEKYNLYRLKQIIWKYKRCVTA